MRAHPFELRIIDILLVSGLIAAVLFLFAAKSLESSSSTERKVLNVTIVDASGDDNAVVISTYMRNILPYFHCVGVPGMQYSMSGKLIRMRASWYEDCKVTEDDIAKVKGTVVYNDLFRRQQGSNKCDDIGYPDNAIGE